jgi:FkbM family methyltransferase
MPVLAEWRTILVKRFVPLVVLDAISSLKWKIYPLLVRLWPRLAILLHEPESTRAFWDAIAPGMIVVDGGANMGGYSLLASRRAGAEGRVFAFEPDPNNFARLVKQVGHLTNAEPVQKAIAAASGESLLFLDSFHAGHTLVDGRVGERGISVGVTSLDDFVRDHSLPGIDVVKLDIEGAELLALDGMQRLLRSERRPVILCEVHPPITPEEFISKLDAFGYRTRILDAKLTGARHDVPVHVLSVPIEREDR